MRTDVGRAENAVVFGVADVIDRPPEAYRLRGTTTLSLVPPPMAAEVIAPEPTPVEDTASWGSRIGKELLDRTVALVALLLFTPVLIVIAVAVKLSGPGPVLFRQVRVGKDGRHFRFVKFRTMVDGAEELLIDLREHNECDGVLFKMRNDPRTTTVGRWLRRFSLDELPQIWHVLAGDMSLVGPRPALPSEVATYEPGVEGRLRVKPGLTGLWQVSGRSDLTWERAVELDLQYVRTWTLAMDLSILARTVPAVVTGRGAY